MFFGNFATIGSYQKYARSLLVGENYEAVRIQLQNERNLLTVTNQPEPQQQAPVQPYQPQHEMAPQQAPPMPMSATQVQRGFEQSAAQHLQQQGPLEIQTPVAIPVVPQAPQYGENQSIRPPPDVPTFINILDLEQNLSSELWKKPFKLLNMEGGVDPITVDDIVKFVGEDEEIRIFDVHTQQPDLMNLKEFGKNWNSPNRERILNSISMKLPPQ
uniref:Uncharacterized protein n=1 Tax=Panagrolaimus sp. ES5 TaxID=591445 RepID=A0AC34G6C7_9BILA